MAWKIERGWADLFWDKCRFTINNARIHRDKVHWPQVRPLGSDLCQIRLDIVSSVKTCKDGACPQRLNSSLPMISQFLVDKVVHRCDNHIVVAIREVNLFKDRTDPHKEAPSTDHNIITGFMGPVELQPLPLERVLSSKGYHLSQSH